MSRPRSVIISVCLAAGSALLSACTGSGDETTAAAGCTYWASMGLNQEISQLMKVEPNGDASVPSLEAYGQTGPSGRPIEGGAQQSVTADGSKVLYAPTSQSAGAFGEGWQLVDSDGKTIKILDWPGVRSAIISPDGQHVAFIAEDDNAQRTYGVQTMDGDVLWQHPAVASAHGFTELERWISDEKIWLREIPGGDAWVADLEGTVTDTASVPRPGEHTQLGPVRPSPDLEHYLGTDAQTVNLYDAEFNVIIHPPDALQFSGLWISDDEFVYLRRDGTDAYIRGEAEMPTGHPDLVSMSVNDDESVVVIEDFGADPSGDIGPYADQDVLPGSLVAACD